MNSIEKLGCVNKSIWFLLIFAAATFLYLYNITFSDMWIDESFTHGLVKHSLGDITDLVKNDFHPPLYFYGLKIFVSLFGVSVLSIRLFSVLGVLSILMLGYVVGQRVFGQSGALYFCLLIISLPMLTAFSHEARMYTWGAFAVTGVYLYSVLFISSNKKNDLLCLMLFSLIAAYTHYYGLLAAFWANIFVAGYLLIKKNRSWQIHLGYSFISAIFYIPWFFVSLNHIKKVEESFWVPAVTWDTILSCFTGPFAHKSWFPPHWPLLIIIYSLTLWVIFRNYIVRKDQQGIVLGLSLFIFSATIATAAIASIFSQPILYVRYIANIVVMLLIPPALFFTATKNKWIKGVVVTVLVIYSLYVSIEASSFSYGPYEQSLKYLHDTYPEIKKIVHVLELTAGPFAEYNNYGFDNYWYNPASTVVYTNMAVFSNLHAVHSIGTVLKKDESFCVATIPFMPFNKNNLEQIVSESQLVKIDTVVDNKMRGGSRLVLYMLQYKCVK